MKILLIINWKIKYINSPAKNMQPSDYVCPQENFWFFKYFDKDVKVDVIDISAPSFIEKIEKGIHFHIWQNLRAIPHLNEYDLILFHGTDSAVFLGALKMFFKFKTPPICVVDISSFHQSDTSGLIFKLCRYASKAFDRLFYHTSSQKEYFLKYFPWLENKIKFIKLGVDVEYWRNKHYLTLSNSGKYCVCVGYRKRDWDTLVKAYNLSNIDKELYLIGNPSLQFDNPKIKVLPFLPIDTLNQYIVNSAFSIIPLDNFNYSFGQLTLLQQMSMGINIIVSDVPSLRDYIKYSEGIFVYEPYNVNDLCDKLKLVNSITDEQKLSNSKTNIWAVKKYFSEQEMAKAFEAELDIMLKRNLR